MKIVYILGNGFDINLGLQTRYSQFYKYYKKLDSKSSSIKKLKNNIESEDSWSDLELKFGEYSLNIDTKEEFIEVFEDLGDNLADYLKLEEDSVNLIEIDKEKFYRYLSFPEESLPQAQRNQVTDIRKKWSKYKWNTYVLTLNYTRVFEKLIGEDNCPVQIGNHNSNTINYQGILHMHGFIDNAMVMGVNDISQLLNEKFHDKPEIINAFVKSKCNQAMQHTIDDQCKIHINSANLICIYGSSIGSTDKLWWEEIGNRLKGDCYLIIFSFTSEDIPPLREYKKELIRENLKELFLEQTKLSKDEKKVISQKIFVGINRDMFDMVLHDKFNNKSK